MRSVAIVSYCRVNSDQLPSVPGFIESNFNPLVYKCFKEVLPGKFLGESTPAILLGSMFGDTATADIASSNLVEGKHHNPLLFYQSVPTSIIGYIAREIETVCKVSCVSSPGNNLVPLLKLALQMMNHHEIHEAVVVNAELAASPRIQAIAPQMSEENHHAVLHEDRATGVHLIDLEQAMRLKLPVQAVMDHAVFDLETEEECLRKLSVERGVPVLRDDFFECLFNANAGQTTLIIEKSYSNRFNAFILRK